MRILDIKVSPQMVDAGYRVLEASGITDELMDSDRLLVEEIFLAMVSAVPNYILRSDTPLNPMSDLKEPNDFGSLSEWWSYVQDEAQHKKELRDFLASPDALQFSFAPQTPTNQIDTDADP
jgi:hypothetical protein